MTERAEQLRSSEGLRRGRRYPSHRLFVAKPKCVPFQKGTAGDTIWEEKARSGWCVILLFPPNRAFAGTGCPKVGVERILKQQRRDLHKFRLVDKRGARRRKERNRRLVPRSYRQQKGDRREKSGGGLENKTLLSSEKKRKREEKKRS